MTHGKPQQRYLWILLHSFLFFLVSFSTCQYLLKSVGLPWSAGITLLVSYTESYAKTEHWPEEYKTLIFVFLFWITRDLHYLLSDTLKQLLCGTRGRTKRRSLVVSLDDLGSTASTYMEAYHHHSSRGYNVLSFFTFMDTRHTCGAQTCMQTKYLYT